MTKASEESKTSICRICEEELTPQGRSRGVFCPKDHYRPCKRCGKEYFVKKALKFPVFCSGSCSAKYRAEHKEEKRQCRICGDEFAASNANARFCAKTHELTCKACGDGYTFTNGQGGKSYVPYCSSACSRGAKGEAYRPTERPCKRCGEPFTPQRPNAVYCDRDHYSDCERCGEKILLKNPKRITRFCSTSCSSTGRVYEATCELCGDKFTSGKAGARFCEKPHRRSCPVCEKVFTIKNVYSPSETCSRDCAAKRVDYDKRNEKARDTLLERYGVDNASKAEEVKEAKRQTLLKRYGVDNASRSPEVRKKREETNLERYGVKNGGGAKEVQARIRETNMKRYGVPNVLQAPEVKKRIQESLQERFGEDVVNPSQVPEIRSKMESTMLERYGVASYLSLPEVQLMSASTQRKRKSKVNIHWQNLIRDELGVEFELEKSLVPGSYYDLAFGDMAIELNPTITHSSTAHYTHLTNLCPDVESCDRKAHIPLSPKHHQDRFLAAEAAGITLLQRFDWYNERVFLSLIQAKLHKDEHKVGARKCEVRVIDQPTANRFFKENHLLGATRGQTYCLGLFHEGELVHVQTYGPARFNKHYQWEAIRSCTKMGWHIPGGFSRCDRRFFEEQAPESVVSYVDLSISTGATELSFPGWELLKTNRPSGMWVRLTAGEGPKFVRALTAQRVAADRLLGLPLGEKYPLKHEDGSPVTNDEVLQAEGYVQVFDAGTRTFVWRG